MNSCLTFQLILFSCSISVLAPICTAEEYATEGSIRLAGGNSVSEGRVEIYHTSSWGTVCDTNWDMSDAEVGCRQLGYPGVSSVEYGGAFDPGNGTIWLDSVECSGFEDRLIDCHNGNRFDNYTWCSHDDDAGVRCIEPEYLKPRLANGSSYNEGRVEVWTGQQWERVCQSRFDSLAEEVVCRQLGYGGLSNEGEEYQPWFGNGDTTPVALTFMCDDSVWSLSECDVHGTDRYNCDGVSIVCNVYEDDDSLIPERFKAYVYAGAALGGISILVILYGDRHSKLKKRKAEAESNNTLATQATTRNQIGPSSGAAQVAAAHAPSTDERKPPYYLPPMDGPPCYSDASHAPFSYGMEQPPPFSSHSTEQTTSAQESAITARGSHKEGSIDDSRALSTEALYGIPKSMQPPAPPAIVNAEKLPSVTY